MMTSPTDAALLALVGVAIGSVLLLSGFGFTAHFREAAGGRLAGMRAQLVLVGLSTLAITGGVALLPGAAGFAAPIGPGFVAGALLFGVAMQLANGCASGVLFALGGGSPRMALVLVGFVAGGFLGSLHLPAWERLPSLPPLVLAEAVGPWAAIALQGALCAGLWWGLRRHAVPAPLLLGALGLAGLNLAVLALAGHPWSVTWAFAVWGAKLAVALGWNPAGTPWAEGNFAAALAAPLWQDPTTLTDLGVILGAFLSAAARGRGARLPTHGVGPWLAAGIGGLAMGYAARLSYGCNVGAFVSGAASTSLHGWLWAALALAATPVGVRLRPLFGLGAG